MLAIRKNCALFICFCMRKDKTSNGGCFDLLLFFKRPLAHFIFWDNMLKFELKYIFSIIEKNYMTTAMVITIYLLYLI